MSSLLYSLGNKLLLLWHETILVFILDFAGISHKFGKELGVSPVNVKLVELSKINDKAQFC